MKPLNRIKILVLCKNKKVNPVEDGTTKKKDQGELSHCFLFTSPSSNPVIDHRNPKLPMHSHATKMQRRITKRLNVIKNEPLLYLECRFVFQFIMM